MAKYKPSKSAKKHIVKKMQDTEGLNTGFGEYKEATGGGTPFEKGNSNTRTTRENGKKREAQNPTTKQPRTGDGKFTYKSVNGQSINPEYGPSRGVTVPPTLTGGVNGIKIDDVEEQFSKKSGAYWDKWKDHFYTVGGKVVTEGLSTKISGKAVWNQAKEYNSDLGEYDSIVGKSFEGKGEQANWTTKTGTKSQAEKAAIQKAHDSKQQQNVISAKHGGIETLGEAKKKLEKVIESKKQAAPVQEEVKEEVKVEQSKPWGKTGKFNEKQAEIAKANVKKMFGDDADLITDDELEETMASNPEIFESLM